MKTSFFCILLFLTGFILQAQHDSTVIPNSRLRYFNTFLAGGLLGNADESYTMSLSTIHGIKTGRLRAGLGSGLDSYTGWRVLPVYASVSFDWARIRKNALFVQLNLGNSFAWKIEGVEGSSSFQEKGGFMINTMIGYRISHAAKNSLYIAIGHKAQRTQYEYTYDWMSSRFTVREELQRLVFLIGFGLH